MTRFRSARKLIRGGYCIVTVTNKSNSLILTAYSQQLTSNVYQKNFTWPEEVTELFTASPHKYLSSALFLQKRTSTDSSTLEEFYNAFIDTALSTLLFKTFSDINNNCQEMMTIALNLLKIEKYKKAIVQLMSIIQKYRRFAHRSGPLRSLGDLEIEKTQIAICYRLMGDIYLKQGKVARAHAVYLVSLKHFYQPDLNQHLQKLIAETSSLQTADDDIESLLSNHEVLGVNSKFKFKCTGCGECCRTSDNILITPYDLFNISRSENINLPTFKLRKDAMFGSAFKYMLKDDAPVCYLRPIKNEKQGHCYFAYEMQKDQKTGELLSYSETKKREEEREIRNDRPVTADEYNLTAEEEVELENKPSNDDDDDDDDDDDENADYAGEIAIFNSYHKPALSCMLGMSGMPAMCSSYPIANESVWADFWHAREPEPESAEPNTTTEWLTSDKYVLVRNDYCEGFFEKGKERTAAYPDVDKNSENETTINEFLNGGTNLAEKEVEKADFLTLHLFVAETLQEKIVNFPLWPTLKTAFVEHLARIWFDFDTLNLGRGRTKGKLASYPQIKKHIFHSTKDLLLQTQLFLVEQSESEDQSIVKSFNTLVKKLNY